VESRVDRALGEVERALAQPSQLLDDAVAVQRSRAERRQEQQVDVAFQYLGTQSIASLGFVGPVVKARFWPWRTRTARSKRWATASSARCAGSWASRPSVSTPSCWRPESSVAPTATTSRTSSTSSTAAGR